MNSKALIEKLNDSDVLPLKVEDSNISHDMIIYLFALEAGTLHDIFEDIILISVENVKIANVYYDYPIWVFYSAKAIASTGVDIEEFKYSLES